MTKWIQLKLIENPAQELFIFIYLDNVNKWEKCFNWIIHTVRDRYRNHSEKSGYLET